MLPRCVPEPLWERANRGSRRRRAGAAPCSGSPVGSSQRGV